VFKNLKQDFLGFNKKKGVVIFCLNRRDYKTLLNKFSEKNNNKRFKRIIKGVKNKKKN